jgi:hypothetical protein
MKRNDFWKILDAGGRGQIEAKQMSCDRTMFSLVRWTDDEKNSVHLSTVWGKVAAEKKMEQYCKWLQAWEAKR